MADTINQRNTSVDQTVQIFDRFYAYEQSINAVEYDVVFSYFNSVYKTAQAAKNFTTTFFRICNVSGISSADLLSQLQGGPAPEITLTFAYYLNTLQSKATLLGIAVPYSPNSYVAHNIKQ